MNSDTLVILAHGFCRSGKNMRYWQDFLRKDFPNVIAVDMPTTHRSFEKCLQSLTAAADEAQINKYSRVYAVGHSMGGLLLREYLQRFKPANVQKLLCVGTPHYGSKLADISLWLGFPWSGWIFPPLHALKCSARRKLVTPEIAGLEIGLIIGDNNAHWPGKLFLSDKADGLVECASADVHDACDRVYVRAPHDCMQYDKVTALQIRSFLLDGKFDHTLPAGSYNTAV